MLVHTGIVDEAMAERLAEARARPPDLRRWRRLQPVKHLLEAGQVSPEQISFDATGRISRLPDREELRQAVRSGLSFITDGCPGEDGEMACNRPFGSYRPGQPFRDFPFLPEDDGLRSIERELKPQEIVGRPGNSEALGIEND